jgi:hypothetical protein
MAIDKKPTPTEKNRVKRRKENREKKREKLTVDDLEALIREKFTVEDLQALIREKFTDEQLLTAVNARHSSETGKFIPKSQAGVYSLSGRNKFKDSDLETKARGEVSAGSNAIKAKFGMNSSNDDVSCGRIRTTDGSEKTKKKRKCSNYKKGNHYKEGLTEEDAAPISSAQTIYIQQVVKREFLELKKQLQAQLKQNTQSNKESGSKCSWRELLTRWQQIELAQNPPSPKQ